MKYIWRVLVIIFCVLLVIGFAFMGSFLPQRQHSIFVESNLIMNLVHESDFDLSKVDKIKIDYGSEEVVILPSESDLLEIKEYMNYEPHDNELSTLWRTGDTLAIEEGERDIVFFSQIGKREKIEIYLPETYNGAMDIEIGSDSLTVDTDLNVTDFDLTLQSGSAKLQKVEAKSANITLSSGKMVIDELSGEQKVDVSSGNLEIRSTEGNGDYYCTSGKTEIEVSELTGDMDIDVTSGKCAVSLPHDAEFMYESKVTSGDIDTYFETERSSEKKREAMIGSNPTHEIRVQVTSGQVDINRH